MGVGALNEAQALAMGQCPHTAVKDTDPHTSLKAFRIHIVEAAVFSALTDGNLTGAVTTWAFAAGDNYEGDISAFALTSGAVVYYEWPAGKS